MTELADGGVVIPQHLAGEALRLLARALVDEARTTGARPSLAAEHLLVRLERATRRPEVPTRPSSASGTGPDEPGRLEISTTAAATLLGCSSGYVRRLARSGAVSARRTGRDWLIDRASLDRWRHRTPEDP